VEPWHNEVGTIEGGGGGAGRHCRNIEEGVMTKHVGAHIVGPFEDLWVNIMEEGY